MIRRRVDWKIRDRDLKLGERTLIMGILNVTPDSFSDGGKYADPEAAASRAIELQEQGADILDVGAESTRPGSERISEAEELRRLIPVLKRLKGRLDIPISVDTYKPGVASLALEHGVQIINDVSGLTWEPDLVKVVRDGNAGFVLNHLRGTPGSWARLAPMRDVMGEIAAELEAAVHRARRGGVELDHIVIDPGLGFGKRREQNSEILARLGQLQRLALPVLIGPSRKSFLAQKEAEATGFATAAAVTVSILNGAYIVRVHDVAAMKPVVQVTDAVIAAMPDPAEEAVERRSSRPPQRDFDLRPDREEAGPPRPVIVKAGEPQPQKPAPPEPPRREDRPDRPPRRDMPLRGDGPPRRDFQPRSGDGKTGDRPSRGFRRPGRDDPGRPGRRGPTTPRNRG